MIIIWRGWGIAAIPVFIGTLAVCTKLCDAVAGQGFWNAHTWPALVSLAVAGLALIGLGKLLGDGHDLFFIPVRMWGGLCISAFMIGTVIALTVGTEAKQDLKPAGRGAVAVKMERGRR